MRVIRVRCARSRGFSLLEVAISIAVISALVGALLVPYSMQVSQRNVRHTEDVLEQAREALLAFAMARGRLPCPASAASAGAEAFAVGGNEANGLCSNFYDGFLPAATLGLTTNVGGYAVDAWGAGPGNRIRYAVSPVAVNGVTNVFTSTNGMRAAGIAAIGAPTVTFLHVCASAAGVVAGTDCGAATTLTGTAPVVLWSSGPNATQTGGTSPDEAQNPNPNGGSADRIYVSASYSSRPNAEFDDVVTWISLGALLGTLVQVGQLP